VFERSKDPAGHQGGDQERGSGRMSEEQRAELISSGEAAKTASKRYRELRPIWLPYGPKVAPVQCISRLSCSL